MNPNTIAPISSQNAAFLTPADFKSKRRSGLWRTGVGGLFFGLICLSVLLNNASPLDGYHNNMQIKLHPAMINATITSKYTDNPLTTRVPTNHVSYNFTVDGQFFARSDVTVIDDAAYAKLNQTIPVEYDSTNPANFTEDLPLQTSLANAIVFTFFYYALTLGLLGGASVFLLFIFVRLWRRTPAPPPFDPAAAVVAVPTGQYPNLSLPATIEGLFYSEDMGTLEFKDGYLNFAVNDATVFRLAYTQITHVRFHTLGTVIVRAGENKYGLSLGGVVSTAGIMQQLGNQVVPIVGLPKTIAAQSAAVAGEYELMRALSPYVPVSGRPHAGNFKVSAAVSLIVTGAIFEDVILQQLTMPAIIGAIGVGVVLGGTSLWLLISWYRTNRQLQRYGLNLDSQMGMVGDK